MTESISVAKTVVYNILSEKQEKTLLLKQKSSTIIFIVVKVPFQKMDHLQGTAISIAMLSCILKVPISNKIAITGEIDIHGYMHAIGGLSQSMGGTISWN